MNMPPSSSSQIPSEHLILALEASGDAVSVAVMQNNLCTAFKEHRARFGHAEHLVGLVSEALAESGAEFQDITHIAAGCGPGSFTGLRVCLSAAKGYALATNARPIGVNGLAALALHTISDHPSAPEPSAPVICFADTRRQSVFAQMFDGLGQASSSVFDLPFDQITAFFDGIYKRYDGHAVFLSGLTEQLSENLSGLIPPSDKLTILQTAADAKIIAAYAVQSLAALDKFPHTDFSPLYVVTPNLGSGKRQA